MPLSFVNAGSADGTTVTIPVGHQIGDLLVMFAFCATNVGITNPTPWNILSAGNASASAWRVSWKLCTSSAETSGTWTNAAGLVVHVYRGQSTNKVPTTAQGAVPVGFGTGATATYTTLNQQNYGTSWIVAFGSIKSITSTIENVPAGLTLRTNTVGAANEYAGFDSNGPFQSVAVSDRGRFPTTTTALGLSAEWRSATVEIFAEQGYSANYQSVDGASGMSVTEKIR